MSFTLKLQKSINKNTQDVFDAFVNPKMLSKWFTTNAKVDLRTGGRYSNADFDEGEYLEIKPNQKIKFTWENKNHCPGTVVTLFFDKAGNQRTRVRLIHSKLESRLHVKDMKSGWQWALSNLKLFLENKKSISYELWLKSQK
jgi:uncharacterized protein YndB with AHSA1/START domain